MLRARLVGCGDADTLGALVAGVLPEAERAAIAIHAASCAPCHAMIESLIGAGSASEGPDGNGCVAPAPVPAIVWGTRIGRYVIDQPLGGGGMSVVYAAHDPELQRRVAIKLLRPDRGDGERLIREARALARLSHPNVVTVFDAGADRGRRFLAIELVDGGTLNAWLGQARRTTGEIIACLLGAARGLAAAHAAGVVHGDVKPDNLLVGRDGRVRVTDFGLARLDTATSQGRTIAGTPAYMAPEQMLGGEADARSDQWALCATLYEALAGVRPFAGDLAARRAAITSGQLAPPAQGRDLPGWVRAIATRGLAADPAARWPAMAAVVGALAAGAPGNSLTNDSQTA